MSKTSTYRVPFKRRGEGRTNYAKRMAFVKSGMPRAVIRKSTNHVSVQFVRTENGKDFVIASAHTKELPAFKYAGHGGNVPAAYLAGYLAGLRFAVKNKDEAIVDLGVQRNVHGTRLFAAINGIADSGVKIKADAVAFPKEERVKGTHVDAFAKKEPNKSNQHQFSAYQKTKVSAVDFSKMVEAAKKQMSESVKA